MSRYFLDTGVVIGFTFLHDMWRTEAEEVFDSDNSFYVSEAVVYEYCNRTDDNYLEDTDVDWETEEGRFGEIIEVAEASKMTFDMKIDTYRDAELDVETLVDDFISVTQINDEVDPEKIEEYIRPKIREFIIDELEGREITTSVAREIAEVLYSTIIDGGRRIREDIRARVTQRSAPMDEREHYREKVNRFINGYIDTVILSDAGHLQDRGVLTNLITSDKRSCEADC